MWYRKMKQLWLIFFLFQIHPIKTFMFWAFFFIFRSNDGEVSWVAHANICEAVPHHGGGKFCISLLFFSRFMVCGTVVDWYDICTWSRLTWSRLTCCISLLFFSRFMEQVDVILLCFIFREGHEESSMRSWYPYFHYLVLQLYEYWY
jgi:hypothetical protein